MDPMCLPPWVPLPGPPDRALEMAFRAGLTPGEMLGAAAGRWADTPHAKWNQTLLSIAAGADARRGTRFILQDAAESRAITIDVLGPPRAAPSHGVSFAGNWTATAAAAADAAPPLVTSPQGAPGPLLVVRFCDRRRGSADLPRVVAALRSTAPPGGATSVGAVLANAAELDLAAAELDAARRLVSAPAAARFAADAASAGGIFELAFLRVRLPTEDAAPAVPCAAAGCVGESTHRCRVCRTPYCSRECQRADWGAGHKLVCAARGAGAAVAVPAAAAAAPAAPAAAPRRSVVVSPAAGSSFGKVDVGISMRGGRRMPFTVAGEDALVYREGEFVVKAQVPLGIGGGDALIYDEARSFRAFVGDATAEGRAIAAFVRACTRSDGGQPAGIKAYLFARTEGAGLRVFLDAYAPWQSRW